MRRERALGAALAAVVLASVGGVAVVPGVVADPGPEEVPPPELDIRTIEIAPGTVSGGTATLQVTTRIAHRRGPARNLTLRLQAVDADSGLVEDTLTTRLDPIESSREVGITRNLSVAREGGYRIEATLYVDGRRVERGTTGVRGVGRLQPDYAASPVVFQEFGRPGRSGLPPIQYTVERTDDETATLGLTAYLTNQGDAASESLRLQFVVRQADSNIVAARTSVQVGRIEPGRTAAPTATVTVPTDYNYYLDAVLWRDGVILASAQSVANLDPSARLRANTTVREVGLEVGDFERDADGEAPATRTAAETVARTGGQPGFTALGAAVAVLTAGLLAWRRSR